MGMRNAIIYDVPESFICAGCEHGTPNESFDQSVGLAYECMIGSLNNDGDQCLDILPKE